MAAEGLISTVPSLQFSWKSRNDQLDGQEPYNRNTQISTGSGSREVGLSIRDPFIHDLHLTSWPNCEFIPRLTTVRSKSRTHNRFERRGVPVTSEVHYDTPRNRSLAIFLVSVLGLFLELLLIRWIGTEIRIFAYLQNTVLIVCFLGLGMGCLTCRQPIHMRRTLFALLILSLLLAVPVSHNALARITEMLSMLGDFVIWYQAVSKSTTSTIIQMATGLGLVLILMVLLWEIFVPLGRLLGRLMDDHPNTIWAYSVNVAGSLVGIGLFVMLSVFYLPPPVWFIVAGGLLISLLGKGRQRMVDLSLVAATIAAVCVANREPNAIQSVWSPYQKLVVTEFDGQDQILIGKYQINVNNCGYQGIIDLSQEAVKANRDIQPDRYGLSQYDIPLLLHPNPERVLIVGAGSGNDAAGALRGGASHITAVEIDPAIIEMGRRYHPERPYDSPKVHVVNDDARSFFATTKEKYDLIIFGLLDSHTTTAMTNARLDHYVYTKESIQRSRSLLANGGVIALSFEARKPFIIDRMASCIKEIFGYEPVVFRIPADQSGWGGVLFVTGDRQVIEGQLAANHHLATKIKEWQADSPIRLTGTTQITTDDWPYIYLEKATIPTLYYLLAVLMLILFVRCKRRLKLTRVFSGWSPSQWHFFFLGAAFLLLEVQNISKASVVLGNTWWVNAVIISGILSMILAANLIETKWPKRLPRNLVWSCLIGSCIALYFIDISRFGFLPYATKSLIVGTLTTLPMLFSGIVFIRSFTRVERKDLALGANLIGSLVGGLLQSITFVTGIKALLLVVAALYVAAMLTQAKKTLHDETDTESESDWGRPEEESEESAELVSV